MATKAQERKALEQIRKIVAGLGEDSYIGTALEGCFEIAEENIDMDTAFSMKGERDLAEKRERELKQVRDQLVEENAELRSQNEDLKQIIENKDNIICKNVEGIADLVGQVEEASEVVGAKVRENADLEAKIAMQEQEIMKLKAKLYDLMVGA